MIPNPTETMITTRLSNRLLMALLHLLFNSNTTIAAFSYSKIIDTAKTPPLLAHLLDDEVGAVVDGMIDDPLLTEIHSDDYSDGLPSNFAYPHCYEPHPIAVWAADRLREELLMSPLVTDNSNCAVDPTDPEGSIGKMFGVLVVLSPEGKPGYYKGYSGTLPGETTSSPDGFVPLVYNRMDPDGFYKRGESELNEMSQNIRRMQADPRRAERKDHIKAVVNHHNKCLTAERAQQKARKKERDRQRSEAASTLEGDALRTLMDRLVQESNADQRRRKALKFRSRDDIAEAQRSVDEIEDRIEHSKRLRQEASARLQDRLFDSYRFLNILGETESLLPIFLQTPLRRPPAGAGDCAAIKMLHHAFSMGQRPIAMAEFWWGRPPALELRKHNLYYPACRGKCEPILGHMLRGIEVELNPLDQIPKEKPELEIIYEDEYMVVVNKPHGMLSVPGRNMEHSIYTEMKQRYPNSTRPLLVHRLDMSTSGLLLVAKDKDTHKKLAAQFIDRSVKKRYTALLEGELCPSIPRKGRIDLPLASDYLHRPMQKVDTNDGKPAVTFYEVVETTDGRTRVRFYPVTGRTHQLRVHAAHAGGLNTPIVGDDIYGRRDDRLCLHAGWIEITHPMTLSRMAFTADDPI